MDSGREQWKLSTGREEWMEKRKEEEMVGQWAGIGPKWKCESNVQKEPVVKGGKRREL